MDEQTSFTLKPSASSIIGKKLFSVIALFLLVALSFGIGYSSGEDAGTRAVLGSGKLTGSHEDPPAFLSKDVDFSLFWKVWDYIQSDYVDRPVSDTQLFYGALKGLVRGVGDDYTVFLDPKTANEFSQELSGSFEGIGAEIGIREDQLLIIAPLAGTPAEQSGVQAGDYILSIDELDTAGMTLENAVSKIRGPRGSTVVLSLFRPQTNEQLDIPVVRDTITIDSVTSELKKLPDSDKSVMYIRISSFNDDTVPAFKKAITDALSRSAQGIVLDLRNNPGGFLDSAVKIASHWIDNGPVVIEERQGERQVVHDANGLPSLASVPTIVLVNGGSASASEIVAGALQDYGEATILGEQTFGKGSVQEFRELQDGSALKITVTEWLTPKGRSINKEGITPDVVMEINYNELEEGDDPMLDRALELLARSINLPD